MGLGACGSLTPTGGRASSAPSRFSSVSCFRASPMASRPNCSSLASLSLRQRRPRTLAPPCGRPILPAPLPPFVIAIAGSGSPRSSSCPTAVRPARLRLPGAADHRCLPWASGPPRADRIWRSRAFQPEIRVSTRPRSISGYLPCRTASVVRRSISACWRTAASSRVVRSRQLRTELRWMRRSPCRPIR